MVRTDSDSCGVSPMRKRDAMISLRCWTVRCESRMRTDFDPCGVRPFGAQDACPFPIALPFRTQNHHLLAVYCFHGFQTQYPRIVFPPCHYIAFQNLQNPQPTICFGRVREARAPAFWTETYQYCMVWYLCITLTNHGLGVVKLYLLIASLGTAGRGNNH